MELDFVVINYVSVEENLISVGVTDSMRWNWEIEDGDNGANARTMIFAEIEILGKPWANSERVKFFCSPYDEQRSLAMKYIGEITAVAWQILEDKLSDEEAAEKYFGMKIGNFK